MTNIQTTPAWQLFPEKKQSFGNKIPWRMVLPNDGMDEK
jgi:hypothetical protein